MVILQTNKPKGTGQSAYKNISLGDCLFPLGNEGLKKRADNQLFIINKMAKGYKAEFLETDKFKTIIISKEPSYHKYDIEVIKICGVSSRVQWISKERIEGFKKYWGDKGWEIDQ